MARSTPAVELADTIEASALALMAWERHLARCGSCASLPFGGRICSPGRDLLRAHGEALHNQIHAELGVDGRPLTDCGECAQVEV